MYRGLKSEPEQALADLRVEPVGADHEVVLPPLPVGESHVDVVVGGVDLGERDARAHLRAGRERPRGEDLVKPGAGEAVAGREVLDQRRPVVCRDHRLAVGKPRPIAADRRAGLDAGVGQPERVKRPQGVARLDDPDSVDAPLWIPFDDVDMDASATKRQRGRQPADSTANHKNLHRLNLTSPRASEGRCRFSVSEY